MSQEKVAFPFELPRIRLVDHHDCEIVNIPEMTLKKNEVVAITGPSGAGKSLYIHALFGMTGGNDTPPLTPRRGAFLSIQDPSQGLTPNLRISHHFKEVFRGKRGWALRAVKSMNDLALDGSLLMDRHPNQLSGGERQRVMLALILAQDPEIVVCDEPASSLDPENEARLLEVLETVRRKSEFALVFITHQMHLIHAMADRVVIFERGIRSFWGSTEAFWRDAEGDFHKRLIQGCHRLGVSSFEKQILIPEENQESIDGKSGSPICHLEAVSVIRGGHFILEELEFSIARGEWIWITGPSGSGKTTLARALAGLIVPDAGHLSIDGNLVPWSLNNRPLEVRRQIQLIFQHGSLCFNPALTVGKQLTRCFAEFDRLPWMEELIRRVCLSVGLDRLPESYSLGELQRMNLLRALAPGPRVLVCDELFSNLDLVTTDFLIRFLEEIQAETGMAVLAITHDQKLQRLKSGALLRLNH